YDKGVTRRRASLAATRGAALRPDAPKALRVSRRAVIQAVSARRREWLGSCQETVIVLSHVSSPSSDRLITCPTLARADRPANLIGASSGRQAASIWGTAVLASRCAAELIAARLGREASSEAVSGVSVADEIVTFEADIKPLFRPMGYVSMAWAFD